MKILWWRRAPTPPTNARIVLSDGTEIPIELVYHGRCRHSARHHHWRPAWNVDFGDRFPVELRIDHLPPKTCLGIEITGRGAR